MSILQSILHPYSLVAIYQDLILRRNDWQPATKELYLLYTAWSLDPIPVPGLRVALCSRVLLKAVKQQAAEVALLARHAANVCLI